jgi:hypothetical protein
MHAKRQMTRQEGDNDICCVVAIDNATRKVFQFSRNSFAFDQIASVLDLLHCIVIKHLNFSIYQLLTLRNKETILL